MNKKGFTLTELLAVIVIMSIVATIGLVSVTGVKRQINQKLFTDKLSEIIASAEKWGEDNKDEVPKELTAGDLIVKNYFESEEEIDPLSYNNYACSQDSKSPLGYKNGSKCKNIVTNNVDNIVINNLKVKIFLKNNRVYACIIKNDENKSLLNEEADYSKYSSLNLYCK